MTFINSIASLLQSFHIDSHDQAHQHDDCHVTHEDSIHYSHEDTYENNHVHTDGHGYNLDGISHPHDELQTAHHGDNSMYHNHEDTYDNHHGHDHCHAHDVPHDDTHHEHHVHTDEHGYDLNGVSHYHDEPQTAHGDSSYHSHEDTCESHHVHEHTYKDEHAHGLNELDHNHSWRGFIGNIFKPQEVEIMKPLSFSEEESHHPPVPPQIPSDFNENKTLLRLVHPIYPPEKDSENDKPEKDSENDKKEVLPWPLPWPPGGRLPSDPIHPLPWPPGGQGPNDPFYPPVPLPLDSRNITPVTFGLFDVNEVNVQNGRIWGIDIDINVTVNNCPPPEGQNGDPNQSGDPNRT